MSVMTRGEVIVEARKLLEEKGSTFDTLQDHVYIKGEKLCFIVDISPRDKAGVDVIVIVFPFQEALLLT